MPFTERGGTEEEQHMLNLLSVNPCTAAVYHKCCAGNARSFQAFTMGYVKISKACDLSFRFRF